jgi:amino acid transporter
MKPTLGLTGLTINAMALIAPGAFLWLTYEEQCSYGAPMAGIAMWFGFLMALLLCFATAISYAELSKLYPGAGSSYFYAEQAFLSKNKAFKYARVVKFITGWASHLYYWVYPGLMVGVTAIFVGYISGVLFPDTFSSVYNSPLEMIIFCAFFSIFVSWIAFRGVNGSTSINIAVNVIQIIALTTFACIAIAYRLQHAEGAPAWHLSNGTPVTYQVDQSNVTDDKGNPTVSTWSDGTNQYQSEAVLVAADLDPAQNKDADALAGYKALTLAVGDPKPDFMKDASGKYIKDKTGAVQPIPSWKTQDRQVTSDDLDKTKNASGEGAERLAALTALGLGVGDPYPLFNTDANGKLVLDKSGNLTPSPFTISYTIAGGGISGNGSAKDPTTFNYQPSAASVVAPHNFGAIVVQAGIAILCLVGFESVSSMGEEALNPKKDIPKAIVLSLIIQGAICYLFEYFATNYVLNSGYTMPTASASSAPIGDLMTITGSWLFGSASAGRDFMLCEAVTVFLALIGTTLACMNTGARVTYAMGRDEELGAHFGLLHEKNLTPHKSIWTLCWISIVIGIITVLTWQASPTASLAPLDKHNIWYSFGIFSDPAMYAKVPSSLVTITLISNFGTFLLYMISCVVAIVAFREHHMFNGIKHFVIPIFGVLANFLCMLFYLVGPLPGVVPGMSWHEPYIALTVVAIWGIYGLFYFAKSSKEKKREMFLSTKPASAS